MSQSNAAPTIHAFEPITDTYRALTRNIEVNGCKNVRTWQTAFADCVGQMFMTDVNPATNRLLLAQEKKCTGEIVPIKTLDIFCEANNITAISFAKIDVEGAEPLVLAGARSLLARKAIGAALVEICPRNLANFGYTVADVLLPLQSSGYNLFALAADGGVGSVQTLGDLQMISLANLLALPA